MSNVKGTFSDIRGLVVQYFFLKVGPLFSKNLGVVVYLCVSNERDFVNINLLIFHLVNFRN